MEMYRYNAGSGLLASLLASSNRRKIRTLYLLPLLDVNMIKRYGQRGTYLQLQRRDSRKLKAGFLI